MLVFQEINYKNTDYTAEFQNDFLVYGEEKLGTFVVTCYFEKNATVIDDIIKKRNELKRTEINHNGYVYQLFLQGHNEVTISDSSLVVIEYTCVGKQIRPIKRLGIFNAPGLFEVTLNTNFDVPIKFYIKQANGTLVITDLLANKTYNFTGLRADNTVMIDGIKGKVASGSFVKWEFGEFLKTTNGRLSLRISGTATIEFYAYERVA